MLCRRGDVAPHNALGDSLVAAAEILFDQAVAMQDPAPVLQVTGIQDFGFDLRTAHV